jgi:hypothetical protein
MVLRPPHDKKGKKKVDEGNDNFQETDEDCSVRGPVDGLS